MIKLCCVAFKTLYEKYTMFLIVWPVLAFLIYQKMEANCTQFVESHINSKQGASLQHSHLHSAGLCGHQVPHL